MEQFLKNVEIKNFKSIKDLKFDAKKVNVFIGKPNVGKSNILEAMSILGAQYANSQKYLSDFIRYESFENLFFDQDLGNSISVNTDKSSSYIYFNVINSHFEFYLGEGNPTLDNIKFNSFFDKSFYAKLGDYDIKNYIVGSIDTNGNYRQEMGIFEADSKVIKRKEWISLFKKYDFKKIEKYLNKYSEFLHPPFGDNLFSIIQHNKEFYKEISPLFNQYDLNLVLKIQENKFEIQKNIDGIVYSYPYSTIADTLQRYIFYLVAIKSNNESVLLLEEPEVHSFPPYTKMLADNITKDETNQYFITTHSPYLLHTIIENTSLSDLNIFITYYENYETKVKALSGEDIRQILDDSIDVFFNLDRFLEA